MGVSNAVVMAGVTEDTGGGDMMEVVGSDVDGASVDVEWEDCDLRAFLAWSRFSVVR